MFWVCVRDQPNFHFSKPVRVTIPHFLNLKTESDIQSLGLTFLKASHNPNSQQMYQFLPTDGDMNFEPLNRFGVLETTHFCSLCIACRDIPECLEKTTFCLTAVLPNNMIPVGKKMYGYFFVTFQNLKTCLRKLNELIDRKNLNGYETSRVEFNFEDCDKDAALEMLIAQPSNGVIGVRGREKVVTKHFTTRRTLKRNNIACLPICLCVAASL